VDLSQLPAPFDSAPVLAGVGAVVLAVIVALVLVALHRRRSRRADHTAPMPEYQLHDIREEVAKQLQARWDTLQRDFVDAPADTLRRADALLAEVMRERGYPAVDADGRMRLLREHEPAHAARYEQLRRALSEGDKDWDTEKRRQALLQVRTLFDALVRGETTGQPKLFAA
jgi:hypothetical protein